MERSDYRDTWNRFAPIESNGFRYCKVFLQVPSQHFQIYIVLWDEKLICFNCSSFALVFYLVDFGWV